MKIILTFTALIWASSPVWAGSTELDGVRSVETGADEPVSDGCSQTEGQGGAVESDDQPAQPDDRSDAVCTRFSEAYLRSIAADRVKLRPGGIVAIAIVDRDEGRIVAQQNDQNDQDSNGREIYEIGSLTKVVTATLLADMVLKGEVSLDDPAEKFLPPGMRMPRGTSGPITLRHLATHSSGLPRLPDNLPLDDIRDPYAGYTEDHLLEFLGRHQLSSEPGSKFEYSNLGYGLLGYLLGRAAGSDFEYLVRERITGPLGMHDTAISLTNEQDGRFVQGHDASMTTTLPWSMGILAGAGGLRSTPSDLLIFLQAMVDPASPIGPALKIMREKQGTPGPGKASMGLGWFLLDTGGQAPLLFHNGGTGGFRTVMIADVAAGRGVAAATNASIEPGVDDIAHHIMLGTPLAKANASRPANVKVEISLDRNALERLVGEYKMDAGLILTISLEGNQLLARISGQPANPIYAEAPLRFFWKLVDADLEFVEDATGAISQANLLQAGTRTVFLRQPVKAEGGP